MVNGSVWVENYSSDDDVKELANQAGVSNLLAKLLLSRGINDPDHIKEFLHPSLGGLCDPFLMCDMEKATQRVATAIKKDEKILIYGDYDVDGVTGVAVIYDFLTRRGGNVCYYIPDRLAEGYGISKIAVDRIRDMGIDLMITVDCGISAIKETKLIESCGTDVIITDHHECRCDIPDAYAVLNPKRPECKYPFKELAGVGVAYKFINGIGTQMGLQGTQINYLDMVALGTVADMVPLVGENRILVKHGLFAIEETSNIGLKALLKVCGEQKKITSELIAFFLAPRINAAGRMGDAKRAVKLFATNKKKEAALIAQELEEENKLRKQMEIDILEEVEQNIKECADPNTEKIFIVAGEEWHPGIIGIAASKITEKYHRPCILISLGDGVCKGSGRGVEGFDLFKALLHCQSVLEGYGGHKQAIGLTLERAKLPVFIKMMKEYSNKILGQMDITPRIRFDMGITREDITFENINKIELLEPFGFGNPRPLFRYNNLKVSKMYTVGQGKHVKIGFDDNGFVTDAIGFNKGREANCYKPADNLDVLCTIDVNFWGGNRKLQLNIRDMKYGSRQIKKNKFYSSLDKCITFHKYSREPSKEGMLAGIKRIDSKMAFCEVIGELLMSEKKTAILLNSIEALESIWSILEKHPKELRDKHKICYLSPVYETGKTLYLFVNPCPNKGHFSNFDKIILYGTWISRHYLQEIVGLIDLSKVYVYNRIIITINEDDLLLKRRDMVAVYSYLKSKRIRNVIIEDVFVFSCKIEKIYGIPMNYFKVKSALRVFEELSLLTKEIRGEHGLKITMLNDGKEKRSLEDSSLFRNIRLLGSKKTVII